MLDQLYNLSKLLFWGWTVNCDLYLFHFIVFQNPDSNCSKSFMPFAFDKVTTGIYSFVSVISNVNITGATIAGLAAASTVMHH